MQVRGESWFYVIAAAMPLSALLGVAVGFTVTSCNEPSAAPVVVTDQIAELKKQDAEFRESIAELSKQNRAIREMIWKRETTQAWCEAIAGEKLDAVHDSKTKLCGFAPRQDEMDLAAAMLRERAKEIVAEAEAASESEKAASQEAGKRDADRNAD